MQAPGSIEDRVQTIRLALARGDYDRALFFVRKAQKGEGDLAIALLDCPMPGPECVFAGAREARELLQEFAHARGMKARSWTIERADAGSVVAAAESLVRYQRKLEPEAALAAVAAIVGHLVPGVEAVERARAEWMRACEAFARDLVERATAEREARRTIVRGQRVQASWFLGHVEFDERLWQSLRPRWVYVLLSQDGRLYCGSTNSLRRRLRDHRSGRGGVMTADADREWFLLFAERMPTGQDGLAAEAALLRSRKLQDALLAHVYPRAVRLQERYGCALPWLALAGRARELELV